MKGFFHSSIARKFWMAITGLFLVTFLVVHLTVNAFTLVSAELFNEAAHFMATNPLIQVMQYVLAAGFIIHIVMGIRLTLQNRKARPDRYAMEKAGANSSLGSRTMIQTGILVLLFLIIHLRNFFVPIKTGNMGGMDDYTLVTTLFGEWHYTLIYVVSFVLLGVHLNHGFQSAFQSVGWKDNRWKGLMSGVGTVYSIVVAGGFSLIAIYHFLF
ncbi:MAG TPA: succinate dehydrogenase [Flavobacteriales bacterium]|nr:succinate dehydrogenase [Flavobacteriales bacterium]